MKKVTAGRDILGEFAPEFAAFNDDVLFGQVWSREEQLSPRGRHGRHLTWQKKFIRTRGNRR